MACVCLASPFAIYFIDHTNEMRHRSNDVLIFNQPQVMADQYKVPHDPLYIGVRMPTSKDVYPVLPLVFEKTPVSIKLADDGFWPRVVWDQATTTLSILTYRHDTSPVYTVAGDPIAKPIEAALIILGSRAAAGAGATLAWRSLYVVLVHSHSWRRLDCRRALYGSANGHHPHSCHLRGDSDQ